MAALVATPVKGEVELSWRDNGSARAFEIWRRVGHDGPFILIGTMDDGVFHDAKAPSKQKITYKIKLQKQKKPKRRKAKTATKRRTKRK